MVNGFRIAPKERPWRASRGSFLRHFGSESRMRRVPDICKDAIQSPPCDKLAPHVDLQKSEKLRPSPSFIFSRNHTIDFLKRLTEIRRVGETASGSNL